MASSSRYGLHSGYSNAVFRSWQSGPNSKLTPEQLILPLFVLGGVDPDKEESIASMPGVKRFGLNALMKFVTPLIRNYELKTVLVFPVVEDALKNDEGDVALDAAKNPGVDAIMRLKETFPDLVVCADVCLCGFTAHGHCGVIKPDGFIDNEKSVAKLAAISALYASSGADVIAPSDMMDGRIKLIKDKLIEMGKANSVAVMSYSVKFASKFYGPFRDAAHSAPKFGDRRRYQLPAASRGLALRCADRDVEEGADFLMVKPAMAFLDVVREVKERHPEVPMAVYQVSGEFAMLRRGADAGAFELKAILAETLTCMRRAGADIVISYFTPDLLQWIKDGDQNFM